MSNCVQQSILYWELEGCGLCPIEYVLGVVRLWVVLGVVRLSVMSYRVCIRSWKAVDMSCRVCIGSWKAVDYV